MTVWIASGVLACCGAAAHWWMRGRPVPPTRFRNDEPAELLVYAAAFWFGMALQFTGKVVALVGVTLAGYWLAEAIGEDIDKYLLPIIAAIIVLSLIPPFLEWRKAKKHPSHGVSEREAAAEAAELHAIVDED